MNISQYIRITIGPSMIINIPGNIPSLGSKL
jgi:hypothetical protein